MVSTLVLGLVILVIVGCAWTAQRYRRARHAALLLRLARKGTLVGYHDRGGELGADDLW